MKKVMIWCCLILATCTGVKAQTVPAGLQDDAAREWIRQNYFVSQHDPLSYADARRKMYAYIVNRNDSIECVYSGLKQYLAFGTETTFPEPFNTEHVVPQSVFGSDEPMRADIHILQPAYQNWNNLRSNYEFRELPDAQTDQWIYLDMSSPNVPVEHIDWYSEYVPFGWEPRESKKGDVARAIMYFFTMYPQYSIDGVIDTSVLCLWHETDTVDVFEASRNDSTEIYQGNVNPYISWPWFANAAWGCAVEEPAVINAVEWPDTEVGVYPNPSDGTFRLTIDRWNTFPLIAVFIDSSGREVIRKRVYGSKVWIQSDLPAGNYTLQLRSKSGQFAGQTSVSVQGR